jgi:hypothetical protein
LIDGNLSTNTMGRSIFGIMAAAALIAGHLMLPAFAAVAGVVVAQTGSPALTATPPDGGASKLGAIDGKPATEATKAKSDSTRLSVPACSMRYAAAKISGKLNGRTWVDFRREECGEKDIEAVFPSAIAPKYSGEDPDKGRTHTCADQFTANKANHANGGMKWVDKDGGYYAECVSRLKG